jgi:NAD(P)-dependent dehydrogenase (short-subunit alcohol dehydrogenase family)
VAKKCLMLGMKVCIADRDAEALAKAERALLDLAPQKLLSHAVLPFQCDVTDRDRVQALKDAVYDKFGEVGFLFNNAGVGGGKSVWKSTSQVCRVPPNP